MTSAFAAIGFGVLAGCMSVPISPEAELRQWVEEQKAETQTPDTREPYGIDEMKALLLKQPSPPKDLRAALDRAYLVELLASSEDRPFTDAESDLQRAAAEAFDAPVLGLISTLLLSDYALTKSQFDLAPALVQSIQRDMGEVDCTQEQAYWCARGYLAKANLLIASGKGADAKAAFDAAEPLVQGEDLISKSLDVQRLAGASILKFQSGDYFEALDMLETAAEASLILPPAPSYPTLHSNLAVVAVQLGKFDIAEKWANIAKQECTQRRYENVCDNERILMVYAQILGHKGELVKQLEVMTELAQRVDQLSDEYRTNILNTKANLSTMFFGIGHMTPILEAGLPDVSNFSDRSTIERLYLSRIAANYAKALDQAAEKNGTFNEDSIAILEALEAEENDLRGEEIVLINLANLHLARALRLEDEASIERAKHYVDLVLSRSTDQILLAETEMGIARIQIITGESEAGWQRLSALFDKPQSVKEKTSLANIASQLALTYGARDQAWSFMQQARALNRGDKGLSAISQLDIRSKGQRKFHADLYLRYLAGEPRTQQVISDAFEESQVFLMSTGGEVLSRSLQLRAQKNSALQEAIAKLEQAKSTRENFLSEKQELPGSQYLDQIVSLDAGVDAQLKAVLEIAPEFEEFSGLQQVSALDVSRSLTSNEAYLHIVNGAERLHVFLIKAGGAVRWETRNISQRELCNKVQNFRSGIDPQAVPVCAFLETGDFDTAFDPNKAFDLYKLVFDGLENDLSGIDSLILSGDGPLLSLPFAALIQDRPESQNFADMNWLVRDFAFTMVPDPASFVALSRTSIENGGEGKLLAMGAPCLGYEKILGCPAPSQTDELIFRGRDQIQNRSFYAPLPGAADELRQLAGAPGTQATLLIGEQATEAALRDIDLADYNVVVFSTHIVAAGENGAQEPGLIFSLPGDDLVIQSSDDGFLAASEISGELNFAQDLVVLAGCNSASPSALYTSSPLTGLGRSFFASGTRALVLSHFPLRDDISAYFTTGLVSEHTRPHLTLQTKMLELIDEGGARAHPAVWSSLIAVGRNSNQAE